MKIAAVNWKLRDIAREADFFAHLYELLEQTKHCEIIVLPEFFAIELLNVHKPTCDLDIPSILAPFFAPIEETIADWKVKCDPMPSIVVAGSNVYRGHKGDEECFLNASPIIHEHAMARQRKIVLTEWERSIGLVGGERLLFHGPTSTGVTVCLDSEFPEAGRALANEGMMFQCVPAWTETLHGFQRVRWACQARAVENQICVVHASLVGRIGNEECHGSSAIIVPPHEPFPPNPIIAETCLDEEGIAIADVNVDDLFDCRLRGEVRNWRDRNQVWQVEVAPAWLTTEDCWSQQDV